MFFFFQAEDGIRDLVRSRGLGDVYKRQGDYRLMYIKGLTLQRAERVPEAINYFEKAIEINPVSYTHLTLPTSDLV